MRVLFIGGSGVISTACAKNCLAQGFDITLVNRGKSIRGIPKGAKIIKADYYNRQEITNKINDEKYDIVVDWIAYTPEHVQFDIDLFKNKTGQYIFISSASVYETPPKKLPITENTPLDNPYWLYARNKIDCENLLFKAHDAFNFPITIVRPSHTYDNTILPLRGAYTIIDRILKNKKVIIHGDGTSLWTLTHSKDFAVGFTGLFGKKEAIGQAFHITADEYYTWNYIASLIFEAMNKELNIIHIPSDFVARYNEDWGASLLGDKSHCMIFNNNKIKKLVPEFHPKIPLAQGIQESVEWFMADKSHQIINEDFDDSMDLIIEKYENH